MNTPELPSEPKAELVSAEVVSALQRQVFALLVALIVVSGTLCAYLYRQTSVMGKDLDQMRPTVAAFVANQATYNSFLNQLGTYGQNHPEFRPVLAKYGIAVSNPGAVPAPKR
jgi:energy-converting hydrogenase Eha subunit F